MRDETFKEISDGHKTLLHVTFELKGIARSVAYLHPELASDLREYAEAIDRANKAIQGGHARTLNEDLADSKRFMGEVLCTLLDKATPPNTPD